MGNLETVIPEHLQYLILCSGVAHSFEDPLRTSEKRLLAVGLGGFAML